MNVLSHIFMCKYAYIHVDVFETLKVEKARRTSGLFSFLTVYIYFYVFILLLYCLFFYLFRCFAANDSAIAFMLI